MDEFNFGQPGRRTPQVRLNPMLLAAVGGLLAAGLLVFAFLSFVSRGGHEVAEAQETALAARDIADDRSTQASLRNALVAAKTRFTDTGSYDDVTAADLSAIEPDLTYTDGPSLDVRTISFDVSGGRIGLAALSSSGTCFTVRDDPLTGVTYGSGTTCTGTAALAAAAPSW